MTVDSELLGRLLEDARKLAVEAGRVTLEHYGSALAADLKGDGTPVTLADRAAERLLRARIEELHPRHGIVGEEFGEVRPGARVRWILDPIDGTKSFMRGVPFYGVLIGIEVEEEPVVGVARFPALDETVSAARGLGCTWSQGTARTSEADTLAEAVVLTTDVENIRSRDTGPGWSELCDRALFSRTWGDCYGHCLVATGRAEVMVDPQLALWDAAPLLTIVTEAGGRFTDLSGEATIRGGSGVSTNGRLHDEVLEILARGASGR